MRVLCTGTSLHPEYGGPAFSVAGLGMALADAGAEVGIWAPDQSAVITPLLPANANVRRLTGTEPEALDRFGEIDILHDSGIWRLHNHRLAALAARRGIPRVVSTRGMLEPWARQHKRLKKSVAWQLYQRRDLERASCLHTTSERELHHLERLALGPAIVAIPIGVDVPEGTFRRRSKAEMDVSSREKIALFLGRLHPVKGLPMLVEAWATVRPIGWRLQIAGPDEGGYRKKIEESVHRAGLDAVVSFRGPVVDNMKRSTFFGSDLLVLPSLSESFGLVVAEALAHSLPVLTTTQAPWSVLQDAGCGWSVDATVDGIAGGLAQATSLDCETLRAMGEKGRALAIAKFGWKQISNEMLSAYQQILLNVRAFAVNAERH